MVITFIKRINSLFHIPTSFLIWEIKCIKCISSLKLLTVIILSVLVVSQRLVTFIKVWLCVGVCGEGAVVCACPLEIGSEVASSAMQASSL